MTILIVDDNPVNLKLLRAQLQSAGHSVAEAFNGIDGLDRLAETTVDAIVSDILMPQMDGYEFCHRVRADPRFAGIPFMFFTATYTSPADEQFALELGADRLVKKPKKAADLVRLVESLVSAPRTVAAPREWDAATIREHSERLVAKLEEKNAELEAATSELRKLTIAVEQTADNIVITDRSGVIRYVNSSFERNTGFTSAEAVGKTPRIVKSGGHDAAFYGKLWSTILSGQVFRGEFINRKKSGELFFEEQTISPVLDHEGEIAHFVAAGRDVTERRKAVEALKVAHQQLKNLFDNLPEAIFSIDPANDVILEASPAHEAVFGHPAEAFIGNPRLWYEQIVPEDRRIADRAEALVREGKPVRVEFRIRKPGGEVRWLEVNLNPFLGPDGVLSRIDGIAADITGRKKADEGIRESDERFRQLTGAITEVFWLSDPNDDRVLYVSPAYEGIWGNSARDLLKNPAGWLETIHPDDRDRVASISKSPRDTGEYDVEYRIIRPDGEQRWIHERAFPIHDEAGALIRIAGIAEDITKRRDLEQQLIQTQKLESLGTLASGIAHDFNNILSIIIGHATMLSRNAAGGTRHQHSIDAVTIAARRGAALVKQLLTFARKSDTVIESVQLNDLIEEIQKLVGQTFPRSIEFKTLLDNSLPLLDGDPTQLHQVLLNICVNARDAMPSGGALTVSSTMLDGHAVRRIHPQARARRYALLLIGDTGTGMDDATLARIFEPFYTTKQVGMGTGLGLALVHSIVTNHGGFVDVGSTPGEGTRFRIHLPIPERWIELDLETAGEVREAPGGRETILVIEDEEMLRELVTSILASKGYSVVSAGDGEAGVDLYARASSRIAAVITDLGLPKLNGADVFTKITGMNPDAKIIIASGYIDLEVKAHLKALGASFFIQKPYLPAELLEMVRKLIDRKPSRGGGATAT